MIRKILILLALCSPCLAQMTGSVNGVPAQSLANVGGTQTAGAGGVTANTFVSADTSAPTRFITASSGLCGAGVALSTGSSGASFVLSDALGTVQVKTDAGGAVAGHLLVGSTVTPGLAMDSGQTTSINVSAEITVCGTALNTVSGGALVTMNPRSRGSYGHKTDQMNGATVPANGVPVTTNASGQFIPVKQFGSLVIVGNSYAAGFGTIQPGDSYASLLHRDVPVPMTSFALGGARLNSLMSAAYSYYAANPSIPTLVSMNSVENDAPGDSCGAVANTACTYNYQNQLMAAFAWLSIPYQFRKMASTATQSGGTWTADTAVGLIYSNPLLASIGTPMKTSTSGAALTFSIASNASTKIGVSYIVVNAQTGTFTVSIDGANVSDNQTGTTTFSSAPYVTLGSPATGIYRQEYTVTPNTAHTVVITNTSSANVGIFGVDQEPPAGTANVNTVFFNGAYDPFFTNYALYNSVSASVANTMRAAGASTYYVDLVAAGVTAADNSGTPTATCKATTSPNHPNDCGHRKIYNAILATALAAGIQFQQAGINSPANAAQFDTGIQITLDTNTLNAATHNTAASYLNVGNLIGGNADFFRSATGQYMGLGFGKDASSGNAWSNQNVMRDYIFAGGWICHQLAATTQAIGEGNYTSKWCFEAASGKTYQLGAAAAPGFVTTVATVTASATPALTASSGLQTITLSANATPTVTGIAAGQDYTLQICQPASGGPFTWAPPAAMHGAITSASIAAMAANTCAVQNFKSFNGTTLEATGAGITGIAP